MHLHALVILLCALYGSVFVFGKLTLEYAPPLFVTASRMLVAGSLLLFVQYYFNRSEFYFRRQHIGPIFLIALTSIYLTNALEFWGLQFMEAGKACFIYSFSPIATALLSYACFAERISPKKWLGLLMGVVGFLPILMADSSTENASGGSILFLSYAELAMLGATITCALGWIVMRHLIKKTAYPAMMANACSMLLGGGFALLHSLLTEDWYPTPVEDFWPFIHWLTILTLVSNIISYNLHAQLLKIYTATYLAFAGLSQPFFAALIAWILLGEVESLYFWLSFIVVSIGLYIYYREDLKDGHIAVPLSNTKNRTDIKRMTR